MVERRVWEWGFEAHLPYAGPLEDMLGRWAGKAVG